MGWSIVHRHRQGEYAVPLHLLVHPVRRRIAVQVELETPKGDTLRLLNEVGKTRTLYVEYPHRDSNTGLWLRRPTLYPLSYGGFTRLFCHTAVDLSNGLAFHSRFSSWISSRTGIPPSPTR
jgi:hypothetical protein